MKTHELSPRQQVVLVTLKLATLVLVSFGIGYKLGAGQWIAVAERVTEQWKESQEVARRAIKECELAQNLVLRAGINDEPAVVAAHRKMVRESGESREIYWDGKQVVVKNLLIKPLPNAQWPDGIPFQLIGVSFDGIGIHHDMTQAALESFVRWVGEGQGKVKYQDGAMYVPTPDLTKPAE